MVPEADTVDTLLTVVRTSQSDRKEGISLVLIDKDDVTSIEQQLSFDETKHLGKVSFNDVKVSKEDVLGGVNQGWEVLEEGLLHLKDRKSTRLNSSHVAISYAVFCLKKKNTEI